MIIPNLLGINASRRGHNIDRRDAEDESLTAKRYAERLWSLFVVYFIPFFLFAAIFFPSFKSDVRFSYRDVAYYYYPLFEQVADELKKGRAPLWNPYVNLGQPLAGDPTSSVFYPGKIIFLPYVVNILSFNFCFKLYLWFHVLLAYFASVKLARAMGVSKFGAALAGISYAFSGQILFQYSNVAYLIGAAWAPLHIVFALAFCRARSKKEAGVAIVKLGVAQALTILGGEPQIVYLTSLASAVAILFVNIPLNVEQREAKNKRLVRRLTTSATFLLGSGGLAFLLAAVQILPSVEAIDRSTRAFDGEARSLWDIPESFRLAGERGWTDAVNSKNFYKNLFCQDFSTNGRNASIYRFSVGPWRWSEFLFPNVGGKQFPQSTRWFDIFPEGLSVWTPSLYFGVAPCLLALSAFRLRPEKKTAHSDVSRATIFATWLVLFGLLGACGGFGLVWFIRFFTGCATGTTPCPVFQDGDPVGGLYWTLNLLIPKFTEFRYPAKLVTLAAIGFSMLAGAGWDTKKDSRRFFLLRWIVLGISITGITLLAVYGKSLFNAAAIPSNPLFGPFQKEAALKIARTSFIQTIATILVVSFLLEAMKRKKKILGISFSTPFLSAAAIFVVACDLYLANSWMVVVSPTKLFERDATVVGQSFDKNQRITDARQDAKPPIRVYRAPIWFPPLFQTESSPRRNDERVVWDVETLYPMYPAREGIANIDFRGAIMESGFAKFIDAVFVGFNLDDTLASLGVSYALGPEFWTQRISPGQDESKKTRQNWRVEFKELNGSPSWITLTRAGKIVNKDRNYRAELISYEPNEIIFLISAPEETTAIISEQYWPDWTLKFAPVSASQWNDLESIQFQKERLHSSLRDIVGAKNFSKGQISQTFGFLRKTTFPRGRFCAVMSYRPRKIVFGAVISAVAWTIIFLVSIIISFSGGKTERRSLTSDSLKRCF